MKQLLTKKLILILVLALVGTFLFSSLVFANSFGFRGAQQGALEPGTFGPGTRGCGMTAEVGAGAGLCGGAGAGATNSMMAIIGDLLDMDWSELQEFHRSGKSWTEIAAEQNVTREELVEAIVAERSDFWQELVDAGTITAAEKEAAIESLTERVEYMLDAQMAPQGGRGGMMGRRGGMMGGFGAGAVRAAW